MPDLAGTLPSAAAGGKWTGTPLWGRNGLVAAQVALSLIMATFAVSVSRAFEAELRRPGFRTDGSMPVSGVRTIEEFYHGNAVGLVIGLVGTVAGMGVLGVALAMVGLHGLVAYAVARRTREIGIRMAVGARRITILGGVLRHGMVPVAWGVAFGVAGSLAAGGVVVGAFPHAAGADPVTYLLAVPGLVTLTLLSAYAPAHSATRIDPLVALRQE